MERCGERMMREFFIFIIIIALMIMPACAADKWAGEEQTKNDSFTLSRDLLFGNPDQINTRISPDGTRISFLAPVNGVLNLWVGPLAEAEKARPVTNDTYRGIRSYIWAYTNEHILYLQDKNGDENWRIYCVNLSSGTVKDLTPFDGAQAQIQVVSPNFPQEIVIRLNLRDPQYHDLFRLNIETGNLTLLWKNTMFSSFEVDDYFRVRLASNMTPEGGIDIFSPAENGTWKSFMKIGMEDAVGTRFVGFDKTGDIIYLVDSRGRDTAALYSLNLKTGEQSLLAEDPKADYSTYTVQPTEKNAQAVAFYYDRRHWKTIDRSIAEDMEYLLQLVDGDLLIASRSLDDRFWLVVFTVDDGPTRYYYYDHDNKEAKFLFTDREKLGDQPLAKMVPVIIKSRDGLDLVSYYTLPRGSDKDYDGRPDRPLPMVLYVHGGPQLRDVWGFDPIHQWLADRGYAVMSVNFRGSTGFGKNFTNAGNLEWGRKMQYDLLDAVAWAINADIADPEKVAIMGGSYGGYATLAGLTFSPQTFACGVDIVGPSNLITFMETIPPYWKPDVEELTTRVCDFRTEEGRRLLKERSPLSYVDRIVRPLLIGQGANDPRIKQNESDQIAEAMQARGLNVTYVLYADEGHGFARPENRISFYAIAEAFLAEHLGGGYEPIGNDLQGANLTVPVGAGEIPGLEEALKNESRG
ncbi:Acylamino-acid-releasing enzyme [uncultured archaeon]|nr:Acylamino-acid-releasing enzyme [uncultured archaeon]